MLNLGVVEPYFPFTVTTLTVNQLVFNRALTPRELPSFLLCTFEAQQCVGFGPADDEASTRALKFTQPGFASEASIKDM